ncbi:MAG: glycosyltransferase family 39 protein [Cyclobacteriaceae bacterium]|nr:glycosyltransferase family 39 protein [Cyclobacteriaceae bacterium]
MNQFKEHHIYVLILITAFFLFLRLGSWGVTETSEARYAEISWEMLLTKDPIHPSLLGIRHFHKPPLTYMVTALAFEIWGVTPFAARFFLQISLLVQIVLVYRIGKILFNSSHQALLAAVIYSSLPAVIVSTRGLTTDSFLASFILGSVYCWFKFSKHHKLWYLYGFYGLLALGFLTKGPLVLLIPLIVVFTSAKTKAPFKHHLAGISLLLIVGSSWYVKLALEDPQFWRYFVLDHTLQRYGNPQLFNRTQPVWYYLVLVPMTSFPWFPMVIHLFFKKFKGLNRSELGTLLGCWIFIPLLFFSFSASKLFLYVLPVYAGIALAASNLLSTIGHGDLRFWDSALIAYQLVISLCLLLGPLITGVFEISWLQLLLLVLMGTSLLVVNLLLRNYLATKLLTSSLVFTLWLIVISSFIFSQNPHFINSTEPLTQYMERHDLQNSQVMVYNRRLPSLAFNLQKPILSIADGHHSLDREVQFERNDSWKSYLVNIQHVNGDSVLAHWVTDSTVLIFKRSLPVHRQWIQNSFEYKSQLGPWTIMHH